MYQAVIGLECHAQLATKTKMFCSCPLPKENTPPNTTLCPTCLAHPGTLPILNQEAVALAIKAALALSCTIHSTSIFARKNYFYPDLPKGYQISQYEEPLATDGKLHTSYGAFGITRIHLEEDAGRLFHLKEKTDIDWNRAGTPLIEIVGQPDIKSPEEAEAWLRMLHRVLTTAGICEGDLEKGQLRCDVNVSIHKPGEPWGTRVEIKNINSFRFVARAIKSELDRQIKLLEAGEVLYQETRTWTGSETKLLRRKEVSADYRYFPEPDLPPLCLSLEMLEKARATLPGIPLDSYLQEQDKLKVEAWITRYGLSSYDVGVLQGEPEAALLFEQLVALGLAPKPAANFITAEILKRWNAGISTIALKPEHIAEILRLQENNTITREGAKQLIEHLLKNQEGSPMELVERLGLKPMTDSSQLEQTILELLAKYPEEVTRYRQGNTSLLGFFLGEVMKVTNRKADPKLARPLVQKLLDAAS
jgi:aspartyl-tRNA(Asn)/glutamyl-tRNA(Gln) amidotransferase subunit B